MKLTLEEKQILAESDEALQVVDKIFQGIIMRMVNQVVEQDVSTGQSLPIMLAKARLDGAKQFLHEFKQSVTKNSR